MFFSVALIVASFGLSLLVCTSVARGWIDSPLSFASDRSLHVNPIPRGGGLGVAAALLFGWMVAGVPLAVVTALTLVWAVSAWDDWFGAAPLLRLIVHGVAAALVLSVWTPELSVPLIGLTAFCLVWGLNLFNFMDGADGLAGSTAVIGGVTLAALAATSSTVSDSQLLIGACLIVSAAAGGMLFYNLPPARIFMGDGGSTVLGLALASLCVKGAVDGVWPVAAAVAVFMPFWADATYTLVRRLLARHSPLRPHREHLYQRLVLAGLGHRGLLLWMIGWNVISAITAFLLRDVSGALGLEMSVAYGAFYVAFTEWTLRRQPNLLMNPRAILALIYDLAAAAAAWAVLFWARFNFNIDDADFTARDIARSLAFVVPVHAAVFVGMGLYQGLWRFASMEDLRRILLGAATAAAGTAALFVLVRPDGFIVPRSVLLLQPALLIVLMGGARFAYRSWREHRLYGLAAAKGEPILILGAGSVGARLVSELAKSPTWRVVALLDDDSTKLGGRVHNTLVVGKLDETGVVSKRFGARHAIIAMPNANHEERRRAVALAAEAELTVLTVPSYDELLSEESPLAKLRAVELEDLLGRDPITLDTSGLERWISGRTVLITGAGGSIGTELCNQVARFHPGRLVMVDISEFASHVIGEHMATRLAAHQIEVYVGDARSATRMKEIFDQERPAIVFHAAAYKHVPLTESVNAWEAVRNNVLGTLVTAECARAVGAEKYVLVSTDKAVRASSIMGASKRLAELAILSLPPTPTQFVGVRFGNVLGSNGSVIPKFREQIAAGGPVTVTHVDMTRYFMSIPEAAQLVVQAGLIGQARSLYVLNMGEPIRIVELAQELIRLAKGSVNSIPIIFTGLRAGEKMHEELTGDGERFVETAHTKVRRVIADDNMGIDLALLHDWLDQPTPKDVRLELKRWVSDFNPPVAPANVTNGAQPVSHLNDGVRRPKYF
jgi:FlaA1/EpsC-like NDP-sugar epimerase/UDP-N-acetylmuramyl pentapeptide phosphotransferase/UDP-N-acetylglucosamine-1-phosphate transferase